MAILSRSLSVSLTPKYHYSFQTHRYVEWRAWHGAALAPVWDGEPVAVELYAHSADDGGFESYVNSEVVNICRSRACDSEAASRVREQLASQVRAVFDPSATGAR